MGKNIRLATADDIAGIMEIVAGTVDIMKRENNPQWDEEYPTAQVFLDDIGRNSLYVYMDDGRVLGFVCVDDIQPPTYAGAQWNSDAKAFVLHRLAVHPGSRTSGIGRKLAVHAESVALQNHVYYIRSDTFSENRGMNALFEKCGYKKTGEIELRHIQRPFFCYDKIIEG